MNLPPKQLTVTLVKSLIGRRTDHRATVATLGLRYVNHSVQLADTPQLRGQLRKVGYLVKIVE